MLDDSPVFLDIHSALQHEAPGCIIACRAPPDVPFDAHLSRSVGDAPRSAQLSKADIETRAFQAFISDRLCSDWETLRKTLPVNSPCQPHWLDSHAERGNPGWENALNLKATVTKLTQAKALEEVLDIQGECSMYLDRLLKTLIYVNSDDKVILYIRDYDGSSKPFYLPAVSSFCLDNELWMSSIVGDTETRGKYDLIVIDPPWPNKSASRSLEYSMIDIYELFHIPLRRLCCPHTGLVAIWITNRPKFRRFIRNRYFPDNGITLLGEWLWLKLARNREPIFHPNGSHRQPYEGLMIGVSGISHIPHFPAWKLFASFSAGHSQKPFVDELLAELLPNRPRLLELFARNLRRGWMSWGNEVLLRQELGKLLQCVTNLSGSIMYGIEHMNRSLLVRPMPRS